ncbi:MAG: SIS domain-containing protein [Nanoarchaeota archaeon]|nr:SIS domain-containing protein [Nanoarchaeota archaeon]
MCGIIGYTNIAPQKEDLIQAVCTLMARGYDSFGISINSNTKKIIHPTNEDVKIIINSLYDSLEEVNGVCIAHTRWATHGKISIENTHPIQTKNCSVVMNGQISNYKEICDNLGINLSLKTQCDTELISYLFNQELNSQLLNYSKITLKQLQDALKKIVSQLKGDFSFLLQYREFVIVFKRGNPLYISRSKNSMYFSSDYLVASTLHQSIEEIISLQDNDYVITHSKSNEHILSSNVMFEKIENTNNPIYNNSIYNNLENQEFYTFQEIIRQGNFQQLSTKQNIQIISRLCKKLQDTNFNCIAIGEGTSYHLAKDLEEEIHKKYNNIFQIALYSSQIYTIPKEYYNDKIIILYSQSGETKDIIDSLKYIKSLHKNIEVYLITNNQHSTLAKCSDFVITLNAGIEIGVASTITYTNALFINHLLVSKFITKYDLDSLLNDNLENYFKNYNELIVQTLLNNSKITQKLHLKYDIASIQRGFSLSNHINSYVLESSLKISELTEILIMPSNFNSLKHGMYSCISENSTIVLVDEQVSSNLLHQLKCRDAITIGFNNKECEFSFIISLDNYLIDNFENIQTNLKSDLQKEEEKYFLYKLLKIILIQKFAYDIAILKQLNPDRPKNLAKSITVES